MVTWVLIVLLYGNEASVTVPNFSSKEECQEAGLAAVGVFGVEREYHKFVCVKQTATLGHDIAPSR